MTAPSPVNADPTVEPPQPQREGTVENLAVFLAPPPSDILRRLPLGSLAHHFGLDTWGGSLLSRRSALALRNTAIVLVVVFAFDLATWSLFFNSVLHPTKDVLHLSSLSAVAFLFAILIATATVIYERDFFVHDTDESFWRWGWALLIRLFVVMIAALATAVSIDLLWFRGPILDRVHHESALSETTALYRSLLEVQAERKVAEDASLAADKRARTEVEGDATRRAEESADKELRRRTSYERQLSSALSRRSRLSTEPTATANTISRLESKPIRTPAEERDLRDARNRQVTHPDRVAAVEAEITSLTGLVGAVNVIGSETNVQAALARVAARRKELSDAAEKAKEAAILQESNLKKFVSKIRGSDPGAPVYEFGESPATNRQRGVAGRVYVDRHYHFFEQLRVLVDLMTAEPPKWRGATPEERAKLTADFGIDYPNTDEEKRRATREAAYFRRAVYGTTGVAILIPMLVLAMKIVAPPELRQYYSSRRQSIALQPDAMLSDEIERETRTRQEAERQRAEARRRAEEDRRRERARPSRNFRREDPDDEDGLL